MEVSPLVAASAVVVITAFVAPFILHRRAPVFVLPDALWLTIGGAVMIASDALQIAPASAWSTLVDLGSFAVGASLAFTSQPGSWPRRVGFLILGIHFAQVLWTNDNAVFGAA